MPGGLVKNRVQIRAVSTTKVFALTRAEARDRGCKRLHPDGRDPGSSGELDSAEPTRVNAEMAVGARAGLATLEAAL
jgi:hypothetical protein